MTNEKTALVILATVGITVAFTAGYLVGASTFLDYGMTGRSFGPRLLPSIGVRPSVPGAGLIGPGMMSPGMMSPRMMGPGWGDGGARQNTIIITNYAFYPETHVVKKGATVMWINMDPVPHTVESGTHEKPTNVFRSEMLGRMESFTFNFTEPGHYVYHCDPHPYMTGKIAVEG